jgi:hypothetical protein
MYSPPFSLVEFSQQAGRAGRDGNLATANILYSDPDLTAKRPAIDKSMVEFIQKCDTNCLRVMLLEYLGDEVPGQRTRCCGYCNNDGINVEELMFDSGRTIIEETGEPRNKGEEMEKDDAADKKGDIALRKMPISKELKEKTVQALKDFRMKTAIALPEGAVIHGLEAAVFGDIAIDKIVKNMKTIVIGDDVTNLCDGMIGLYANEVAAIVCEIKKNNLADKQKTKTAVEEGGSQGRRGQKNEPSYSHMLNQWQLPSSKNTNS